jgi:hypothetical protein
MEGIMFDELSENTTTSPEIFMAIQSLVGDNKKTMLETCMNPNDLFSDIIQQFK